MSRVINVEMLAGPLMLILAVILASIHTIAGADVCYQCASTLDASSCSNQAQNMSKNCSGHANVDFKRYYCITQTIEQRGRLVAIIRDCTSISGLGITWCNIEDSAMTGFAIKCTHICSDDLCNGAPINTPSVKSAAQSLSFDSSILNCNEIITFTYLTLLRLSLSFIGGAGSSEWSYLSILHNIIRR